jgi:hypothetical protein
MLAPSGRVWEREVNPMRRRPVPHEFALYYDI